MKRRPLRIYTPPRLLLVASVGLCFAPMVSGCGEAGPETGQPYTEDDPEATYPPALELDPLAIDFGAVDPDQVVQIHRIVSACNQGDSTVHIQDITIRDQPEVFEIHSLDNPAVEPNACSVFMVGYRPQPGQVSEDAALIACEDDGCPVELPLRGEGVTAR